MRPGAAVILNSLSWIIIKNWTHCSFYCYSAGKAQGPGACFKSILQIGLILCLGVQLIVTLNGIEANWTNLGPAFVGLTNPSGHRSGISVRKFTRSQDFCRKLFLLCRKIVGNCWETFFYGYVTLLHVLLTKNARSWQHFTWSFPGMCVQWATWRDEEMSPSRTKGRLAPCLLWNDGSPKLNAPLLECNTCLRRHPSSPPHRPCGIWDARETANKHARCLCGYPLSNQVLCLW